MRNVMDSDKVMLVTGTQSIDIQCDIDSIEGSVRGVLKDAAGRSRTFSGWTEFASALMAMARDTEKETNSITQEEE